MGVTFYIIAYVFALSIHFLGSELAGTILLYAIGIPIIDFFIFTYDLVKGRLKLFSILRTISFLILAVVNYYSFSYLDLPYPLLFLGTFIITFTTFIISVRKHLKNFVVRLIVYIILILFTGFNAWMSNLERLYFYTLVNPFYSNGINAERLYSFAYLYNQESDKERTYYLLNKCGQKISEQLRAPELSEAEKNQLKKKSEIVQNSITLVMQNKWEHKEKFWIWNK